MRLVSAAGSQQVVRLTAGWVSGVLGLVVQGLRCGVSGVGSEVKCP